MSDDGQLPKDTEYESEADQIVNAVFDATPVLIAYLDNDLNFVRVNRAYAAADGKSPDYFVGKHHFDLFPNRENERIFKHVIASGKPYTALAKAFEYERSPERGTSFWDWTLTPVKDGDGRVNGAVLSLLDVTSHVETSVELDLSRKELQSRVDEATEELRKSLAQKEALLQEIHHRVKNNLAMVSAFLKLKMRAADYPPRNFGIAYLQRSHTRHGHGAQKIIPLSGHGQRAYAGFHQRSGQGPLLADGAR